MPFLKLDTYNWDIVLHISAQKFDYIKNANKKPIYTIEGKDGFNIDIDTQTYTDGTTTYINETNIPIHKYEELILTFEYFNLREAYSIHIDSIMIFNDTGELLTGNKLINGLYYVVCNSEWNSDFEGILDIYASGLEGFKVYEIQLNEEKAIFKSTNSIIEYIGSNFSNASLVGINIVEGITIDDIKISIGDLPELLISLRDINPNDNRLIVYMNDGLILSRSVNDLIQDTKLTVKEDFKLTFNLNKYVDRIRKVQILKLKILLTNKNNDSVFSEEFWNISKNKFIYKGQSLLIKSPPGTRIKYGDRVENAKEFTIPLNKETGEIFSIFYNRVGWKQFKVEVPTVKFTFRNSVDSIVDDVPKNLLASQLDILKGLQITWESNSSIPMTIYFYDSENVLESRLHFKNKMASASIYAYYDILKYTNHNDSLAFHWAGSNRNSKTENIINIFKKWEIYDIDCYSKEGDDEYLIELKYKSNFDFQSEKFLRVYNEDSLLFEKRLKDEQMIIYVKKSDIKSLNLNFRIVYFEELNDIFGKTNNEIIAGQYNLKLASKINDLNSIKKYGLLATGFKYTGKSNNFKIPFKIQNIEKTDPINFIDEELYIGQAKIGDKITKVLFYLNVKDKTLPFLLDLDRDGAQYNPKTGDVFWENRSGKEIMGPIDDIRYIVEEE